MKLRPVHLFLVTALIWTWLCWWPVALSAAGIIEERVPPVLLPIGGFGMILIACIFAFSENGWGSVRKVFSRSITAKVGPAAWIGLFIPAILLLLAMAVYALVAKPEMLAFRIPISFVLIAVLVFAWVEETVWRGFALPRLLNHHSPLVASCILAAVWVPWHFPMYWLPDYNAWGLGGWLAWVPWYVAYTFFLTWLAMRSRFSVLIATLSHFLVNWVIGFFKPAWMENVAALGGCVLLIIVLVSVRPIRKEFLQRA